jgi:hypothetical protein
MTTRKKIREQVQLLYNQFVDKNGFDDEIDVRLIDIHVEQSINRFLKVQVMNNIKAGNIQIPTCNIIEYTLIPASNAVTLPVYPMSLPMDMGVWKVSLASNGLAMIPINSAMANVYGGTNTAYLEGQTGYTVKGNKIRFTTTVTTSVLVELLVSDFTTTGETDPLPVSPDVEADVITDVLERISQGRFSQTELNVKQNAN